MTFWMYHKLTGSVYPVPAETLEEVAHLADTLPYRIYFEADLTTQPVEPDAIWCVEDRNNNLLHTFLIREEAFSFARAGKFPLYRREIRPAEVFMVKQDTEES